ncbi:MAG: cystathionine beta-synthase [Chloroflexi bacterium RBG_16_52_11]|nr:MAG: cystathionine beta-synthase [Chloroflexi bacterium RBG_16_52_11]
MKSQIVPQSDAERVYDDILQTIGKTPLVRLERLGRGLPCPLYAKVEFFNPGGSVKDRIAVNIIEKAERSGLLKSGGTVVEATSGNTGVGLAIVCAKKGYRTVFVMPDKMSQEKIQLLRAFGAKVVITPTAVSPEDPRSYYSVANRIVAETPNAILANQYHNPENPLSHYLTTGPEIWEQTRGQVTDVVIGMGTGGTISGVGRYLKERNSNIRMIGVDPVGSLLLETWQQGHVPNEVYAKTYKVEGIGEDFLPSTLDLSVIDEVIQIGDKDSFLWARRLVREEGIFCGGSSGTAIAAAMRYAQDLTPNRLVVVILPDSGSRYLSKFYDDKWMKENSFLETEWSRTPLDDVLAIKSVQELISVRVNDRMTDVIALLKAHDISQVPVLYLDGTLAGLVTEVDLLKHMLENSHVHSADETVAEIVSPTQAIFPASAPIDAALPAIMDGQVALITRENQPVGILTKIDLLDYIAQTI